LRSKAKRQQNDSKTMDLKTAIRNAKELCDWLWDQIDGASVENELRGTLALGALTIALHHHKALIFLVENGSYQSFMALLRPQADAWVNGAWLHLCATEKELKDFAAGTSHVQPREIYERLEAALGTGVIASIKAGRWKEMCDFTHTGILQLQRNLTADSIEASYPEDELIRALQQADACALIAATFAAGVVNDEQLANRMVERASTTASE
jgi:ribosome modulation factor